jgi:uncharacterized membrane protein YphA (DoxX/SURF4 family)
VNDPSKTILVGRVLLASGLGAIAVQNLVTAGFLPELQPVPSWWPAPDFFAILTGATLAGACAFAAAGKRVRTAGTVVALILSLWTLVLHVPRLAAHPTDGGVVTGAFEILALAGAAWMLAAGAPPDRSLHAKWNRLIDRAGGVGMICYAVSLPVFGILHFVYIDYVASVIPAWIPGHVFWGYATGVAHIAAGLSIVTGIAARLAARLLGVMFGAWVVLLHVPRAAADVTSRPEWTSLLVALAMCGGAWLVAARRS